MANSPNEKLSPGAYGPVLCDARPPGGSAPEEANESCGLAGAPLRGRAHCGRRLEGGHHRHRALLHQVEQRLRVQPHQEDARDQQAQRLGKSWVVKPQRF